MSKVSTDRFVTEYQEAFRADMTSGELAALLGVTQSAVSCRRVSINKRMGCEYLPLLKGMTGKHRKPRYRRAAKRTPTSAPVVAPVTTQPVDTSTFVIYVA